MKTNGRDVSRLRVEYEGGMADTDALVMVEERTVGMLSPVDGRGMKTAYFDLPDEMDGKDVLTVKIFGEESHSSRV